MKNNKMTDNGKKVVWATTSQSTRSASRSIEEIQKEQQNEIQHNYLDEDLALALMYNDMDNGFDQIVKAEPLNRESDGVNDEISSEEEDVENGNFTQIESNQAKAETKTNVEWITKHDPEISGTHNAQIYEKAYPEHILGEGVKLSNNVLNDMLMFSERIDKVHGHRNAKDNKSSYARYVAKKNKYVQKSDVEVPPQKHIDLTVMCDNVDLEVGENDDIYNKHS